MCSHVYFDQYLHPAPTRQVDAARTRTQLATALLEGGHGDEALEEFQAARWLPWYPTMVNYCGTLECVHGDEALEEFQTARWLPW